VVHDLVKTAIAARLSNLIVDGDRGEVYIDRTRVVSRQAGLSVEPDVVVVLWESFETGRVRCARSSIDGRSSALYGAPDVIVEIVSMTEPGNGPINGFERLDLLVFDGWP
jgi:Uma2 family endonuclease